MYLTEKQAGHPRAADDHEEIELLLESFSKQCEEIVSEVETLSVRSRPLSIRHAGEADDRALT